MDVVIRFGACSIDVPARIVEREGEPRHLEPQAFDVLAHLVANADRVVPKDELFREVWGHQFVSESALTTRIKEIRGALGDDGARQAIIRTVRGRGYRFVAAIEPDGPSEVSLVITPDRLVGRERDLGDVAGLLRAGGVLTLVGPGGVGKTALAEELAHRARDRHVDGVAIVRLAELADPASVVHAVRAATDLVEVGDDGSSLLSALAGLDALVVLDNCEHVLDAVGAFVSNVVAVGASVTFLATSRERLGVAGEQVWPVAPLRPDAARALLRRRARLVRPDFDWDDDHSVEQILEAVDRLPLAIEMVAARLPMLGVDEMADVLRERLDLLRSAERQAVDRHRTVDALVGWSEGLLDDDERSLLTAMTVFAGPVPSADVAGVVGADPMELAVGPLAALVDKSLVVAETSERTSTYRLLETVRACARRRRPAEVDMRHARHIAGLVANCDRSIRLGDEARAISRLDALTSEIRAAHAWARVHDRELAAELTTSLLWYAHERHWTEPAAWAVAMCTGAGDRADLAAAAALAADAANRGGYDDARELAGRAVASLDPRVVGSALDTLANVGLYTGDLADARRHARTLTDLGVDAADAAMRVMGVVGEVLALVYDDRSEEAWRLLDSVESTVDVGPTCQAWIAYVEGELFSASEHHREAVERFERSITLGTSVGSHFVVGVARVSLLAARARTGDVTESLAAFRPVLVEYRRMRNDSHGVTTLRNLVEALVRGRHHVPAMELLGALSGRDVKATYGLESAHLDAARRAAAEVLGEHTVDLLVREGSRRSLAWALDHAIDVLDTLDGSG